MFYGRKNIINFSVSTSTLLAVIAGVLLWLLLAALLFGRTRRVGKIKWLLMFSVRGAAAAALILALCEPVAISRSQLPVNIVVLADLSKSVSNEELAELQNSLGERLSEQESHLKVTLVAFDRSPAVMFADAPVGQVLESFKEPDYFAWRREELTASLDSGYGGLEEAYQLAANFIVPGQSAECLLLSDGRLRALPMTVDSGIAHRIMIAQHVLEASDVAIRSLRVEGERRPEARFDLVFDLHSERETTAELEVQVLRHQSPVWRQTMPVKLRAGNTPLRIDELQLPAGSYEVHAELIHQQECHPIDNFAVTELDISGPRKILVVSPRREWAQNIINAAIATGHEIEFKSLEVLRNNVNLPVQYPFAFLVGCSPDDLPDRSWRQIRELASDSGVGLCVVAGESWEEIDSPSSHVMNSLLPVTIQPRPEAPPDDEPGNAPDDAGQKPPDKDQPPGGLKPDPEGPIKREVLTPSISVLLLIDRSGSMSLHNRIEIAKASAIATTETLDENDMIGLCAFDAQPHWLFRPTLATNTAYIIDSVKRLRPGGGTAFHPALESASREFERLKTNVKHIILLSDGESQQADFESIIKKMSKSNITLSTVFIGKGVGGKQMALMARWGQGNYYPVTNLQEVPRIFTHDISRRLQEYESGHPQKAAPVEETPVDEESPDNVPVPENPPAKEENPRDPPVGPNPPQLPAPEKEDLVFAGYSLATRNLDGESLPEILGWMRSEPKTGALVAITTRESEMPVLAEWQLGLSRVFYLGTDTYLWGAGLAGWDKFPQLIHQIINSGLQHTPDTDIQFEDIVVQDGNRVQISFLTYDAGGKPIADLENILRLTSGDIIKDLTARAKGVGYFTVDFDLPEGSLIHTLESSQIQNHKLINRKMYHFFRDLPSEIKQRYRQWDKHKLLTNDSGWQQCPEGIVTVLASMVEKDIEKGCFLLLLAVLLFPLELLFRRTLK
ncbi:VWA domain-containing protein [Planctomycetota bacterium]